MSESVSRPASSYAKATGERQHCQPVALRMMKRGKRCHVAKLVTAQPLGEFVLASVYRHQRGVKSHVSVAPSTLNYARKSGARKWIVRFDEAGRCLSLDLSEVERIGYMRASEGIPEWFVPLAAFQMVGWQDWRYVTEAVDLPTSGELPGHVVSSTASTPNAPIQSSLFGSEARI